MNALLVNVSLQVTLVDKSFLLFPLTVVATKAAIARSTRHLSQLEVSLSLTLGIWLSFFQRFQRPWIPTSKVVWYKTGQLSPGQINRMPMTSGISHWLYKTLKLRLILLEPSSMTVWSHLWIIHPYSLLITRFSSARWNMLAISPTCFRVQKSWADPQKICLMSDSLTMSCQRNLYSENFLKTWCCQ